MNRDELLDKLAMKLDKWPSSKLSAYQVSYQLPSWAKWTKSSGRFCVQSLGHPSFQITKNCWLQRREELINCPPDSEAPDWAEWKAQDADGIWCFYQGEPGMKTSMWDITVSGHKYQTALYGKIPSGHDWRTTLTRINRDDNTSTPEEDEEFERIQARQDADKPHEADARMLDAQLISSFANFGVTTKQACENMAANIKALHEYDRISEDYSDAQLEHDIETFREVYKIADDECAKAYGKTNANSILNAAAQHMQDRAATYDKPKGERSMAAAVDAFRATTGIELTEEQGWHFMALLKLVRSQQGEYRADSYEDGVSYVALAGEAAAKARNK